MSEGSTTVHQCDFTFEMRNENQSAVFSCHKTFNTYQELQTHRRGCVYRFQSPQISQKPVMAQIMFSLARCYEFDNHLINSSFKNLLDGAHSTNIAHVSTNTSHSGLDCFELAEVKNSLVFVKNEDPHKIRRVSKEIVLSNDLLLKVLGPNFSRKRFKTLVSILRKRHLPINQEELKQASNKIFYCLPYLKFFSVIVSLLEFKYNEIQTLTTGSIETLVLSNVTRTQSADRINTLILRFKEEDFLSFFNAFVLQNQQVVDDSEFFWFEWIGVSLGGWDGCNFAKYG